MPLYEYEILDEKGDPVGRFEVIQSMSDKPLTVHPETGKPCRRVISAPTVQGKGGYGEADKTLKDDNKLERLGFTKYVKTDTGKYDKTCGNGPDILSSG